ncbi:MAG: hypothetical protein ACLFR5_05810 [Halobacteriales archaeon]
MPRGDPGNTATVSTGPEDGEDDDTGASGNTTDHPAEAPAVKKVTAKGFRASGYPPLS